jgi:hypothetical protein
MKKTFLSLAFLLSISISASFADESKPVVGESKTSNEQITVQSTHKKMKVEPVVGTFITSCGEEATMEYDQMPSTQQIECDMAFFESELCDNGPGCD